MKCLSMIHTSKIYKVWYVNYVFKALNLATEYVNDMSAPFSAAKNMLKCIIFRIN